MNQYLNIFSTVKGFEEIVYLSDEHSDLHKLMTSYSQVVIDMTNNDYDEFLDDDESALNLFILECPQCPSPTAAKPLFEEIDSDISRIVDFPKDIFILNYDDEKCSEITNDYGVFVTSDSNIKYPEIFNLNYKWSFLKNEIFSKDIDGKTYTGWRCLLDGIDLRPLNSLIIIDDYLFNNSHNKRGNLIYWGEENLINLLNSVLPYNLKVNFHILIVTQNSKNRSIQWHNNFIDRFETKINELRDYKIRVGLIIHNSEDFHHRCIITNYIFGDSNWGFSVFHNEKAWKNNDLSLSGNFQTLNSQFGDVDAKKATDYVKNIKSQIEANNEQAETLTNMNKGFIKNRLI